MVRKQGWRRQDHALRQYPREGIFVSGMWQLYARSSLRRLIESWRRRLDLIVQQIPMSRVPLLTLLLASAPLPCRSSCVCDAGSQGDPHLTLAHGARADFRGRHGRIFNFLSANDLSVNMRTLNASFFLRPPPMYHTITVDGSFLTDTYIVARTSERHFFNITFAAAGADSEALTAACGARLGGLVKPALPFACDDLRLEMRWPMTMVLTTPNWRVSISKRPVYDHISGPFARLDLSIELRTTEKKLPTSECHNTNPGRPPWPHLGSTS